MLRSFQLLYYGATGSVSEGRRRKVIPFEFQSLHRGRGVFGCSGDYGKFLLACLNSHTTNAG